MVDDARQETDWVGSYRSFAVAWGIPIAAMVAAIFFPTPVKTVVWMIALVWMGAACLANASRCGRRHCFYTGPFFLVMAAIAGLHGFGIIPLGSEGWRWLGISVGVGGGLLWYVPEYLWGKFAARRSN